MGVLIVMCAVLVSSVEARPSRVRSVIRRFLVETRYPNGRPGFVVDHVIPLCAGGTDGPPNLQWQERQASYRKDVFERQLCAEMQRQGFVMVKR